MLRLRHITRTYWKEESAFSCVCLDNVYFSVLNMLMQNNKIQSDCVNRTKACLSQRGEKKSGIVGFFLCTFIELWVALLLGKLRSILCGARGGKKEKKSGLIRIHLMSQKWSVLCADGWLFDCLIITAMYRWKSPRRWPAGSWNKLMWLLEWADCLFTCKPRSGTGCTPVPRFRASKPGRRRKKKEGKGGRGLDRLQKNFLSIGSDSLRGGGNALTRGGQGGLQSVL